MERSALARHDNDADACGVAVLAQSELIQKLHGCEIKNRLPIGPGFRETVNQSLILLDSLQPLAGENGPGAVAKQTF
jgi:hypothetical protein